MKTVYWQQVNMHGRDHMSTLDYFLARGWQSRGGALFSPDGILEIRFEDLAGCELRTTEPKRGYGDVVRFFASLMGIKFAAAPIAQPFEITPPAEIVHAKAESFE